MYANNVRQPKRAPVNLFLGVVSALSPFLAGGLPAAAQAQQTPLPTRDELDPQAAIERDETRRVEIEGEIERAPCALADPAYADIKVTLTEATFNNLGPLPPSDLRPAYAAYLGQERPIGVICDIRDAAATILRRQGYLAAVQVPTQRIEGGVVRFEVLYAKITAVRVLGNAGRNEATIERYLSRLADGEVFNRFAAERYLLLARDIPGQDIRLSLKPAGTGAGEMIGEVTLRVTPLQADLNIQNYAPKDTGRFGGQLRAIFNGLTGLGDRTIFSVYSTADFQEQQVVQAGHDMLLGGQGLRVGGRFTYAWTEPSLAAGTPSVKARTAFANLEASYPFVRSQALTLRGALGLDLVNQKVRFAGLPLSRDRLRIVYARLEGDAVDMVGVGPGGTTGWRVAGALELRRGLDILSASPNCIANPAACAGAAVPPGLLDGDSTATVLRFSGLADLRVASNVTVVVLPRAQVASNPVAAFEQYSAGNYTVGRGYDPGIIAGDSGVGFQTEVRLDDFRLSSKAQLSVQPYAFADNAWVWNKLVTGDPDRLSSLGGGVRVTWTDRARLDLSVAVPMRRAGLQAARGDARFLMTLTTNLWPWRNR